MFELFFLVSIFSGDEIHILPYEEVKQKYPEELFKFYEKRVQRY